MNKYTHTHTHTYMLSMSSPQVNHQLCGRQPCCFYALSLSLSRCNALHCALLCHARACPCVMGSSSNNNNTTKQQQQLWQLLRLRSRSWVTRLRQVMLWLRSLSLSLSLSFFLCVCVWPLAMHICCCCYHTKHCLTSITDNQQQPLLVYNWSAYKMAACLWIAFPLSLTHTFSCYRLTIERTVPLSLHVWWRTCISFYRHSINT